MNFAAGAFLLAMAAAAGPAIIHLLNRRRFRTVSWGAMQFLREALKRNRRWMRIRDLLLLALRTLVIVLFVLAMARPYWTVTGRSAAASDEAVHAICVLDNSLSMGYRAFDEPLLDTAKEKAREFIRRLPKGSVVSVIPMCLAQDYHVQAVYHTPADAIEAIDQIPLADREAWAGRTAELVVAAARRYPERPTKRVVFLGDRQGVTWAGEHLGKYFGDLREVQLAQVGPDARDNTFVDSLYVQDGIAGGDQPCTLVTHIRHEGAERRRDVRVQLSVDGTAVAERFVDLEPGQDLQLVFEHHLSVPASAGEALFVPAEVSLSPDRLVEDDSRSLIIPVMGQIPVLFIDRVGPEENPAMNLLGETFPLRRLLTPVDKRTQRPLFKIRHRRPDQVRRGDLADARLVVVAGIDAPSGRLVRLLRSYVEQGGQLLIGAGGDFDPAAWTRVAGDGRTGILPLPLDGQPIGTTPRPGRDDVKAFRLDPDSLTDEIFDLGLSPAEQRDLAASPFFFKAVGVDETPIDALLADERKDTEQRRVWLAENDANEKLWADLERKGELTAEQSAQRDRDRRKRRRFDESWLTWTNPLAVEPEALSVDAWVERCRPRVMGRYDNGKAFAVRRTIRLGQVVFVSTGFFPRWNNIAADPGYSILLLDQLMRRMITLSLPDRNLGPVNEIVMPLAAADQGASFLLHEPGEATARPLSVEALGSDRFGLIVRDVYHRGVYGIEKVANETGTGKGWTMQLAVNGPAAESELKAVDVETLRTDLEPVRMRFTAADQPVELAGESIGGGSLWKWLIGAVLLLLIVEMLMLAAPQLRGSMSNEQ